MKPINNLSDWWGNVDEHWNDLVNIIGMYRDVRPDEFKRIEEMKDNRDEALWSIFQRAWSDAPDKPYIHEIPSWYVLCDLCSEGWVFDYKEI